MSSQVKSHLLVIASNNLQDLLQSFLTCCVEYFQLYLLPIQICFSLDEIGPQ